jgi:hypothetical protein
MSVPICAWPECGVMAAGRCVDCENIFCVSHMSSTSPLICDGCRDAQAERAAQARSRGRRIVYPIAAVCFGFIGAGVGGLFISLLLKSIIGEVESIIGGVVIGAVLGAAAGVLLVWGHDY